MPRTCTGCATPTPHESRRLVYAKLCGLETVGLLTDDAAPSLEQLGKMA